METLVLQMHPLIRLERQQNVSRVGANFIFVVQSSFALFHDLVAWVSETKKLQLCMCVLVI